MAAACEPLSLGHARTIDRGNRSLDFGVAGGSELASTLGFAARRYLRALAVRGVEGKRGGAIAGDGGERTLDLGVAGGSELANTLGLAARALRLADAVRCQRGVLGGAYGGAQL